MQTTYSFGIIADDIKRMHSHSGTRIAELADGRFKVLGQYLASMDEAKAKIDGSFKAVTNAINKGKSLLTNKAA